MRNYEELQRMMQMFEYFSFEGKTLLIKRGILKPTEENIRSMENRYWNVILFRKQFVINQYEPAFQAIEKTPVSYAFDKDRWIEFKSKEWGVSPEYLEPGKIPDNIQNEDIGNTFQTAFNNLAKLGWRKRIFQKVFETILEDYLWKHLPEKAGITLKLNINDRFYWYSSRYNKNGVLHWEKLHWPEDEMMETTL